MKKILSLFLALLMLLSFVACSSVKGGDKDNDVSRAQENLNQAVNPVSDVSIEEAQEALHLKTIKFSIGYNCNNVQKITDGDNKPDIYSFDLKKDKKEYELRLKYFGGYGVEEDISGIYFDGKVNSAVYDSADIAIAPSVHVLSDGSYTVAYGLWNGYCFSVSTTKMNLDMLQAVCIEIVQMIIDSENCIIPE